MPDKPEKIDHKDLVDPEYPRVLEKLIEEHEGLSREALQKAGGFSRQLLWRFFSGADVTIKNAATVYNAIKSVMPELDVPKPVMPIRSRIEYRWVRIGQIMAEKDPDAFRELVGYASRELDHVTLRVAKAELRKHFEDAGLEPPDDLKDDP